MFDRHDTFATIIVLLVATLCTSHAQANDSKLRCEKLSALAIKDTAIKAAYITTPQELAMALGQGDSAETPSTIALAKFPFCRVEATTTPAPGAEINNEVWLPPADKWNGRFLGAGNGGPAGVLSPPTLAAG